MPIPLGVLAVAGAGAAGAAGAYEWLETVNVGSGGQTSIEFTNLSSSYSATYQHLQLRMTLRSNRDTYATDGVNLLYNGNNQGTRWHYLYGNGTNVTSSAGLESSVGSCSASQSPANAFAALIIDILDPFETTKNKTIRSLSGQSDPDAGGFTGKRIFLYSTFRDSLDAITGLKLVPAVGSHFVQYSRVSLYGLRSA